MRLKKYVAMFLLSTALVSNSGNVMYAQAAETEVTAEATTQVSDSTQDSDSSKDKEQKEETKKSQKTKKGSAKAYTKKELRYMASIIYCEAGNQSYAGKLAVGIVVKNRMESKRFPNTIKGVLYQKNQFTPTRNGALNKALKVYDKNGFKTKKYSSCLKAAKESLSGVKTVTINNQKKNMKGYHFFSRYVSGCRIKIGAHMFK